MKEIYHVEIEENLQKAYDIIAESLDEAFDIAKKRYDSGEYELEPECITNLKFTELCDPTPIPKKENIEMER